jgi:hypothetical protein
MTLFCPEGYVPVQVAIARAAQYWFPEQMTALETATAGEIDNKPSDGVNALTPLERLADAFRGQPSISEGLRQQVQDLLTQTEDREARFASNLLEQEPLHLLDRGRGGEPWKKPITLARAGLLQLLEPGDEVIGSSRDSGSERRNGASQRFHKLDLSARNDLVSVEFVKLTVFGRPGRNLRALRLARSR